MKEHSIPVLTHGRFLTIAPGIEGAAPMLVGFHGYGEDAETQLERLRAIPGSERWLLVSIQGLHRFYNRRSGQTVASWMTRQDRELAIADNLAYVEACLEAAAAGWPVREGIVFAGFSQGVAMAFRAAAFTARRVAGVIAAGGDVPPGISAERLGGIPAALIARGETDPLYAGEQFAQDQERLIAAGVKTQALRLDAGHEWTEALGAAAGDFLRSH